MILDKSYFNTIVKDMDETLLFTLYGILYDPAPEIGFKEKLYILCNYLDNIKTTIYRFNDEDHERTEIVRTMFIAPLTKK